MVKQKNTNLQREGSKDHDVFQRLSIDAAVNLQFSDLSYIANGSAQTSKIVVDSVSGEFKAGELSAIIGPSGCGKTTLMNLLSGYRIFKTSGQVKVNNKLQNLSEFGRRARYILQDDNVPPYFTVMEIMMFASNFKLDSQYDIKQRRKIIEETLNIFQLQEHSNTMLLKLSGGQRKRVCIALELLDNPAVLFLDEPTSGLDEFSSSQCLTILKTLALSGRTIICSIHCPSARLLQMFDKVYAMAKGQCIYQGAVQNIVPYLKRINLNCPLTYNPVDFIIEVSVHAYGDFHNELVHEIENGKILEWFPESESCRRKSTIEEFQMDDMGLKMDFVKCRNITWWMEYKLLFLRNVKLMLRDKVHLGIRIGLEICAMCIIAAMYVDIGVNGKYALYNYHSIIITYLVLIYLSMVPNLLRIPQEIQYLKREYFNHWYRLSSYYMALMTSQLPYLFIMTTISSAIIYFGTNQPPELFRFALFVGMAILTAMMASSFGLFIGSRFSVVNALFLGVNIMSVNHILANYGTERLHLATWEKIIMYSSCLRYPLEGFTATYLLYNRKSFVCPPDEMFCMMSKPRYILKLLGFQNISYTYAALAIVAFYILFAILAFVILKCRLSPAGSGIFERNRHWRKLKYLVQKKLIFN